MKTLSREAHVHARTFLFSQARPLEQAFYAYEFEGGPREAVFAALAAFQNPDGGFGHGMEPDLQLADSSALATTVGLQHLRALGASSEDPLVQGAMAYLLRTYDAEQQTWVLVPSNTDDAPHAPWWSTPTTPPTRGGFLVNPRAEIVGYLWEHAELVPSQLRDDLTEAVTSHLAGITELPMGDDFLCYLRLAQTQALPASIRTELWGRLVPLADKAVNRDATQWNSYVVSPLKLIDSPSSPLMAALADDVARNLDFEIDNQEADGSWAPTWSWFGLYTDDWPAARRQWQGVLTLHTLRTLRAFGRLA